MDESAYSMPGQLIDVGEYKLHISCTGSGSPTVILEAGLGQPAAEISGWIQPGVATATQVCVYDRAGMGWSEPAETPRDGVAIATDLHMLLERAEIDGPYVLAGHSSGGVYRSSPSSIPMRSLASCCWTPSHQMPSPTSRATPVNTRVSAGSPRCFPPSRDWAWGDWPTLGNFRPPARGMGGGARVPVHAGHNRGYRDDAVGLEAALTQAQALTSLDDKPLIVLTAVEDAHAGWLPLQEKMAGLSTNSVQRVIQDASHASLIEEEVDSANAIDAILDVVEAVRSRATLRP